jgi:hypothetical protein
VREAENLGVRSNFLYPAVLLGTSKQVSRALFGR